VKELSRRRLLWCLAAAPAAAGAGALLIEACEIEREEPSEDRAQLLRDLVANVIVPTYVVQAAASDALLQAASALREQPSEDTLAAAQDAWRSARALRKQSEAFLFGPGDDLELTGGVIDSPPADGSKIDALIAGEDALDGERVARLGANQRGFPALEYLLFDSSAPAAVLARLQEDELGPRRGALIVSLAEDLASKCQAVADAWDPENGYGHELAEAGIDSKIYRRQSDGVDELVTGLLYVAELMVMSKLAKPLGIDSDGQAHPEFEEAPRSDASLDHLRDNLRGIQAIYTGERGDARGQGLAQAVRAANPGVAQRFEGALAAAFEAIDAVNAPFRVALIEDRSAIDAVYQAVRTVKQGIQMEVAGALGASIGFGFSDTD
jgi:predicted lipoprotein